MSARATCRRCGAILSAYRASGEPEGFCAACATAQAPVGTWRVLDPEELVLAVAGVLASAAAERPSERVHVQQALEARGILAGSVDVHLAVKKLRRRYRWHVDALPGRPGYCLKEWPYRFRRRAAS